MLASNVLMSAGREWLVTAVSLANFFDDGSGLSHYDLCAGSTPFASDILPCTDVGLSTAVAMQVPGGGVAHSQQLFFAIHQSLCYRN